MVYRGDARRAGYRASLACRGEVSSRGGEIVVPRGDARGAGRGASCACVEMHGRKEETLWSLAETCRERIAAHRVLAVETRRLEDRRTSSRTTL